MMIKIIDVEIVDRIVSNGILFNGSDEKLQINHALAITESGELVLIVYAKDINSGADGFICMHNPDEIINKYSYIHLKEKITFLVRFVTFPKWS